MSVEEIERVNKILSCDNCPASYACEACDITWADKNLIKKYIDEMEGYLERISKQLDNVAIDQIPIAIKELQQENKTLKHTNKSYKGMLNKQNKTIDEMTETLVGLAVWDNEKEEPIILWDKEEVKQFFEKKVE